MARMKFLCDAERCIECNGCVTACKNENEVPWGVNRRRVITLNDGVVGAEKYPLILTSGRLVEYEGGGEETRSNPWLAELQQENFVEINPKDAESRGIKYWDWVWVKSPTGAQLKVRALVTERVGPGTSFIPFHFGGWWQGKDLLDKYPEGAAPIVRGDAVNTATTYGYDSVTMMQETKTTVCQIERA